MSSSVNLYHVLLDVEIEVEIPAAYEAEAVTEAHAEVGTLLDGYAMRVLGNPRVSLIEPKPVEAPATINDDARLLLQAARRRMDEATTVDDMRAALQAERFVYQNLIDHLDPNSQVQAEGHIGGSAAQEIIARLKAKRLRTAPDET
jgi:hypothetical protein